MPHVNINKSWSREHWLLCTMAFALLLGGCGKEPVQEVVLRPVRSVVVATGANGETATYTAEIRSRYETDLSFQVGGKLVSRSVDVGAVVKRGQALISTCKTTS